MPGVDGEARSAIIEGWRLSPVEVDDNEATIELDKAWEEAASWYELNN